MVPIAALWLPILASTVLVFVASSLMHTVLSYHKDDFRRLPDEDAFLDATSDLEIPPGDYVVPHAASTEALKSEAYRRKLKHGPVAFMTVVRPDAVLNMGPSLALWFGYSLLIGVFAAYLAGRMLGPDASYLDIFRVTGTVAFACYSVALLQRSIWYKQRWATTFKSMADGLVYALLTAGCFGWLWPN